MPPVIPSTIAKPIPVNRGARTASFAYWLLASGPMASSAASSTPITLPPIKERSHACQVVICVILVQSSRGNSRLRPMLQPINVPHVSAVPTAAERGEVPAAAGRRW